jgi:hypothetical protein
MNSEAYGKESIFGVFRWWHGRIERRQCIETLALILSGLRLGANEIAPAELTVSLFDDGIAREQRESWLQLLLVASAVQLHNCADEHLQLQVIPKDGSCKQLPQRSSCASFECLLARW